MIIRGKVSNAKVYATNIEDLALQQIQEMCNNFYSFGSKIAIMPDAHAGKGCTIGTTMTISNRVVPNLVGVDIGCGMLTYKLNVEEIDFAKLDEVIKKHVPSGFAVRQKVGVFGAITGIHNLKCFDKLKNVERLDLAVGSLGGGNHFIEMNEGTDGSKYLVIHSGSRNLGHQVCSHYQNLAYEKRKEEMIKCRERYLRIAQGVLKEQREEVIKNIHKIYNIKKINKDTCYLTGEDFNDYIHDMKIVQKYATLNRIQIGYEILKHMDWLDKEISHFETIHNYIDTENMILRKGAISAQKREKVLIPLNMRDGSIIAIGKGNEDWNCSAPHGAGRIMSRNEAMKKLNLDEFKETMSNVWTSSVCKSTMDEAPMAYKPKEDIISVVEDTVDIVEIIKPIYNYKAH